MIQAVQHETGSPRLAIDVSTELTFPVDEAPNHWPGSPPSVPTVWRAILKGMRARYPGADPKTRVKLESIFVGGRRRVTSKEAIVRFINAINNPPETIAALSASQRLTQAEAAEKCGTRVCTVTGTEATVYRRVG